MVGLEESRLTAPYWKYHVLFEDIGYCWIPKYMFETPQQMQMHEATYGQVERDEAEQSASAIQMPQTLAIRDEPSEYDNSDHSMISSIYVEEAKDEEEPQPQVKINPDSDETVTE